MRFSKALNVLHIAHGLLYPLSRRTLDQLVLLYGIAAKYELKCSLRCGFSKALDVLHLAYGLLKLCSWRCFGAVH